MEPEASAPSVDALQEQLEKTLAELASRFGLATAVQVRFKSTLAGRGTPRFRHSLRFPAHVSACLPFSAGARPGNGQGARHRCSS